MEKMNNNGEEVKGFANLSFEGGNADRNIILKAP